MDDQIKLYTQFRIFDGVMAEGNKNGNQSSTQAVDM